MVVRTAADPTAFPAYPRLDGLAVHKDVSVGATLVTHATQQLLRHRRPPAVVKLDVDPTSRPTFGSWRIGDRARVVIDDGYSQVDGQYRIVAWEMTLDADGAESVSLTTEQV